jgi:chorismate mutase / prephenate dehydratase
MANEEKLLGLRNAIDSVDQEIMALISKRAGIAQEVAEVKLSALDGDAKNVVFYRPEREAQVLKKIMERNNGPLPDEDMARLFREIMSVCLSLEQPLTVAYLGPEGTFTQQAAVKHFGHAARTKPLAAIDEVFREVEAGAVHYGVVPVENSTGGAVDHTLDSFMNSKLKIVGEVELRIHHNVMIGKNTRKDNITRVYSHQQSLSQCRKWLDVNMPNVERIAVSSNAEAAKRVANEWNSASISPEMAADLYDLEIIEHKIEDRPDNTTRFLIIANDEVSSSGDDKTSMIISMRNQPGALYKLLKPFNEHGIDLTRLETRPSNRDKWTYVFFVDFNGHIDDENVQNVLSEIEKEAVEVQQLGSYPIAVL